MNNDKMQIRFGNTSADPQELVEAWHETRPGVAEADWNSLWQKAVGQAASDASTNDTGSSYLLGKITLAASLLVAARLGWQMTESPTNQSPEIQAVVSQDHQAREVTDLSPQLVLIDLQEADDLAIIRLDDQRCTPEAPCLETVEAATAESGGTAIASNFQLFNDLESIANDLR